jgi:hypothetical protein
LEECVRDAINLNCASGIIDPVTVFAARAREQRGRRKGKGCAWIGNNQEPE